MHTPLLGLGDIQVIDLIMNASTVVKGIMVLLAAMSLIGWYIIGYKYFFLSRAMRESELFQEAFWKGKDIQAIYTSAQGLKHSPLSAMFLAGYSELSKLQQGDSSSAPTATAIWRTSSARS
jgi:biopolymer transport protein TolQ